MNIVNRIAKRDNTRLQKQALGTMIDCLWIGGTSVDRKAGCDFDTERWIIRVYRQAAIRGSRR
jgi:hypothetical protein